ncbi:MAG: hypothetical protein QXF26_05780 [Candidatus Bathyarchaeia archaeon]
MSLSGRRRPFREWCDAVLSLLAHFGYDELSPEETAYHFNVSPSHARSILKALTFGKDYLIYTSGVLKVIDKAALLAEVGAKRPHTRIHRPEL